jgi:hypothetical protein
MKDDSLFVWRWDDKSTIYTGDGDPVEGGPSYAIWEERVTPIQNAGLCKYCGSILKAYEYSGIHGYGTRFKCRFCGWIRHYGEFGGGNEFGDIDQERILVDFDINSAQLAHGELCSFLKTHYDAVHSLSPRRFEMLISDIYKDLGYRVEITKATRDGGKDLIVFNDSGERIAVEVKRYQAKIGVDLIRQLRGVQLTENITKAVLITTSAFTRDAQKEKEAEPPRDLGFELELVDADGLIKLFNLYNTEVYNLLEREGLLKRYDEVNQK